MIKAIIFDMDGVIMDSEQYHLQSYNEVLKELGIQLTNLDFKRFFGIGAKKIITQLFEENNIKRNPLMYVKRKDERYREIIKEKIKPLPGVVDLINNLNPIYRLCVASSSARLNVEVILKTLGILSYFEFYLSGDDVTNTKPDPEPFLTAAKKFNLNPDECLVIEDAVAGIQAANAAGMKCIAVTTTMPREKLTRADLVVDSLEELDSGVISNV